MSSEIVIHAENLTKKYQIYSHPKDRLKQFISSMLNRLFGFKAHSYYSEFLALDSVNLDIRKGESVGIIGLNGSGKSTLLHLICGTLHPSLGNIKRTGRIAALLELGAGFNPEFSGRENVRLVGAIFGLSDKEIDDRYEDIAKFADIGDFLERPVKTYSSGMFVRLAFSVIAHCDADILVIDEALAVGDAIFTQKCMRFIRNFKNNGTLFFVSHDTAAVINLCDRAIWLHQGKIKLIGKTKEVVESYLHFTLQETYQTGVVLEGLTSNEILQHEDKSSENPDPRPEVQVNYSSLVVASDNVKNARGWKTGAGKILSVELKRGFGSGGALRGGEKVIMEIKATVFDSFHNPIIGFLVRDRLGQDLFGENTLPLTNDYPRSFSEGQTFKTVFVFRLPMLPNGKYTVMASLAEGTLENNIQHHWLHDALVLEVSSSKVRWGLVGVEFDSIEMDLCD